MNNNNIYVDGTFDLLHPGHISFFKKCKQNCNQLIVGVIGDENVKSYKRLPIMNLENRSFMLENIKCVDKVISDCPFFGITEDFLNKYNITKVAYAGDDLGKWEEHYKVPIQKKIMINFKYDSSNTNISTSSIIKKIKNSY